jgi:hypothetical protein
MAPRALATRVPLENAELAENDVKGVWKIRMGQSRMEKRRMEKA